MDPASNSFVGQLVVNYGQPAWKSDYEQPGMFDKMTNGQVWRMGSNFWTVLDTSLSLRINGRDVEPGYYYLGMHRSEDGGTWSLAFLDSNRIRGMHLDGSEIAKAPVEFMIPVKFESSEERIDKLDISLNYPKGDPTDVTLVVGWGNFRLTTPVEVTGLK